jgi:hypothetical protein
MFLGNLDFHHRLLGICIATPGSPAHEFCALGWNPVKRGLAEKPEDWPWSSFRHYSTGEIGTIEIESFWTGWLRDHGGTLPGLLSNMPVSCLESPPAKAGLLLKSETWGTHAFDVD